MELKDRPEAPPLVLKALPKLILWASEIPSASSPESSWKTTRYKSARSLNKLADMLTSSGVLPSDQPTTAIRAALAVAAFAASLNEVLNEQSATAEQKSGAWKQFLRGCIVGLGELDSSEWQAADGSDFTNTSLYRALQDALENDPAPMPAAEKTLRKWFMAESSSVSVCMDSHKSKMRMFWLGLFTTNPVAKIVHPTLHNSDGRLDLSGWDLSKVHWRGVKMPKVHFVGANLQGARLIEVDFTRAVLRGADLSGATLTNAKLQDIHGRDSKWRDVRAPDIYLHSADLTGADLTGADLSRANLASAILDGVVLSDTNLCGAFLFGVDLQGQVVTRVDFSASTMTYANFKETTLEDCLFVDARLKFGQFFEAKITGSDFSGAALGYTDFTYAECDGTNFTAARNPDYPDELVYLPSMVGANFSDASLLFCELGQANFQGTYLNNVGLMGAKVDGVNFSDSVLAGTDLSSASLVGARFHGAELRNTNFQYADLTDVVGLTLDGLAECIVDDAKLPPEWGVSNDGQAAEIPPNRTS